MNTRRRGRAFVADARQPAGKLIPLVAAIASLSFATAAHAQAQETTLSTVTVKADIASGEQPATLVNDLAGRVAEFQASLPDQVRITVGGTVETSAESQQPIAAVVPIMLLIMALLVMIQMQGFRLSLIVFSAAPLGVIGVVAALLPFGTAFAQETPASTAPDAQSATTLDAVEVTAQRV